MALFINELGEFHHAQQYYERALAIGASEKMGAEHVDVASSYNNLAIVLSDQGDLEQAKEYHERALAIRLEKLGAQHVDVATSYDNLANVLSKRR